MTQDRIVALDGPLNFRDLGGYKNSQGQEVKWNRIYRADSLARLSANDAEKLTQRHITIDCDLRSSYETRMAPDKDWQGRFYVHLPIYSDKQSENKGDNKMYRFFHHIPNMQENYMGDIYQRTLLNSHSQAMFAQVFRQLLELPDEQALVFHCSAGKDRTGMTAALILMALGVDDDQIARDYLLTNNLYDFAIAKQFPSNDEITQMVNKMNVTKGEGTAILGITQTIRAGWGSFAHFFERELGFSKDDYEKLRAKYLA